MDFAARRCAAGVLNVLVFCNPAAALDGPTWTLAILPDTQHYVRANPEILNAQTVFLADQKEELNLQFVLQEGDITHNNTPKQWQAASTAFQTLEAARIPYALAQGNHDIGHDGDADSRSSLLSTYFPVSRLASQPTFGGVYAGTSGQEAALVDNNYSLFSAGVNDWLVLSLEFGPRDEVVDWADRMLKAYPNRKAIIVTHAYLYSDSTRYDWATKGTSQDWNPHQYDIADQHGGVNDGEQMWQKLKDNPNLTFVFNGHVLNDGTGYLASEGTHGNVVHQVLANYQFMDDGGLGYMRLLEFTPDNEQVTVRTYSPWLAAQGKDPYLHEIDQEFRFHLDSPGPRVDDVAVANLALLGPALPTDNTAVVKVRYSDRGTFTPHKANRGDYEFRLNKQGLRRQNGVLLASVTENARDGVRGTATAPLDVFTQGNLSVAVHKAGNGKAEINLNTSVAWFDFNDGWYAAHVDSKGRIIVGAGIQQRMLTKTDTGRYLLDLGIDSRTDGMLFTIANHNGPAIVSAGVRENGQGWDLRVSTNVSNFAATGIDADFSLVYLPFTTPDLIGGYYDDSTNKHVASVGDFSMTKLREGQYKLTIPGVYPEEGTLLLATAELVTSGGITAPEDNFLTYQSDGKGSFLINSYDIRSNGIYGAAAPGLDFQGSDFVWAFIGPYGRLHDTAPIPMAVPEPGTLSLATISALACCAMIRKRRRAIAAPA